MDTDIKVPLPAKRVSVLRDKLLGLKEDGDSFTYPLTSSVHVTKSTVCIARTKYAPELKLTMAVDSEDPTLLRVWKRG